MSASATEILKNHQLRITDCRLDVLQFFVSASHSISSRDLEDAFPNYDRVTLYRTLHSFEEKGIIHSIPNETGIARYGLCFDTCEPGHHDHAHIHFKCDDCGVVDCLPTHSVPVVAIPGFQIKETNMIVSGICEACSTK